MTAMYKFGVGEYYNPMVLIISNFVTYCRYHVISQTWNLSNCGDDGKSNRIENAGYEDEEYEDDTFPDRCVLISS